MWKARAPALVPLVALIGLALCGARLALGVDGPDVVQATAWIRLLAIAFGAVLVTALVKFRTRSLVRNAQRLDAEVARRTAELEASNRELLEAKRSLAELARRDPLTGLYNRRAADERLHELCAERHRYAGSLAVLLFDLDDFKPVNDGHGHEAGDVVLKAIAVECARSIRGGDFLARWGGDEFLLIYPWASAEDAVRAGDRIRRVVEGLSIRVREDLTVRVTLSGGIATLDAHQTATPGELIALADSALYEAKNGGRNRVAVAGSPVDPVQALRIEVVK